MVSHRRSAPGSRKTFLSLWAPGDDSSSVTAVLREGRSSLPQEVRLSEKYKTRRLLIAELKNALYRYREA